MDNQVLSIEQMKSLIELGIDTSRASMCWIKNTDGDETENKYMLSVHNEWCYEKSYADAPKRIQELTNRLRSL